VFSARTALSAVQISIDPVGTSPDEGSFMNYHDDWYYLWFNHAIFCGFHVSDLPAAGQDYDIRVGRSRIATRLFVDMDGAALDNGGEYIVYGSNGYVYASGGQGVLTGEYSESSDPNRPTRPPLYLE
jgi:arabinan endo-1,5-alpha-L-arabinosidase